MIQRVSRAEVRVAGETVGSIYAGFCILLGAGPDDTPSSARHLAERIASLRVLGDDAGRMNLDPLALGAAILVVSQFTLYADTSRGHRPSFLGAAPPALAADLYEVFVATLRELGLHVSTGKFGARMELELVNDGPVTIVLSSGELPWPADAG